MKLDAVLIPRSAWLVVFVLPFIALLTGCGSKQMYHVSGKVAYKDGSVPKGAVAVVLFAPAEDSTAEIRKGASGSIEPDGSFEMVTRMPGDGVNRGNYGVTFRVIADTDHPNSSLVAAKYTTPTSPQFKVTVDRDISDLDYVIEKADGPAVAPSANANKGPGMQ